MGTLTGRLAALILTAAAGCADAAPDVCAKPNIVFIISDDHRWDTIGAAGNPNVKTPHIDRLAREGVHFIQGTMHIPQCSPARAQLITGLPPHRNGWYANQYQRADIKRPDGFDQYPTVPGLLREGGYRTALVGKWHLDPDPWNCGFSHIGLWLPPGGGPYQDVALASGRSRERKKTKGFLQEVFTDSAVEFLKGASKEEKPFFLWVAYTAPHTPLKPNPERISKLYEGKSREELLPPGFEGEEAKRNKTQWNDYYAAISLVDEQVGRIVKTLDEERLTSNTVVVFLGDNGYMMGNRGWAGKVVPYEGSIRVPFVVRAPGIATISGRSDAAASSLDLSPTLLEFAGIAPPKAWPGRSLVPALRKREGHGVDYAISEFPDNENTKFGDAGYRLIRTAEHKLIDWTTPSKPDEFYDLESDPGEKRNLIAAEEAKGERDRLAALLKTWRERTGDDGRTSGVRTVEKSGKNGDKLTPPE